MIYLTWFGIGFCGALLQVLIKMKSLEIKSRKANLKFSPLAYLKEDFLSLSASILTLLMCLFLIDEVFKLNPKIVDYVKWLFAFIGYTGSDIMTRIFGVMNKQINNAIDDKTTIADEKTGNLDSPTPIK